MVLAEDWEIHGIHAFRHCLLRLLLSTALALFYSDQIGSGRRLTYHCLSFYCACLAFPLASEDLGGELLLGSHLSVLDLERLTVFDT